MSLSDLYNIRKVLRSEREDKGLGAGLSEDKKLGAQGLADRTCIFCRKETAKYVCPSCNAAYCSTTCFNSPRHGSCTKSFARRVVEENKDVMGGVEDSEEDEKRRRAMMEILRKFEVADPSTLEEDEENDTADSSANVENVHSVEELLSMLSEEEQETFHAMLRDHGSRERLIEQLMKEPSEDTPAGEDIGDPLTRRGLGLLSDPWWKSPWRSEDGGGTLLERLQVAPKRHQIFVSKEASFFSSLQDLIKRQRSLGMDSSSKRVDLRFNLLAVILSYAYTCRHLAVESLAAALSSDVRHNTNLAGVDAMDTSPESTTAPANAAYGLLDRLVPFLTLSPSNTNKRRTDSADDARMVSMVLADAEDVSLWLLSRLGPDHVGSQPGALLLALIQDAEKVMLPPPVVASPTVSGSASNLIAEFPGYPDLIASVFDVWLLLDAARVTSGKIHPAQAKLLFYLSQFLESSKGEELVFERRLRKERTRLDKEQERATVEEDFRARDRYEMGRSNITGTVHAYRPPDQAVVQEMEGPLSSISPAAAPAQSDERKKGSSFGDLRKKRAARG